VSVCVYVYVYVCVMFYRAVASTFVRTCADFFFDVLSVEIYPSYLRVCVRESLCVRVCA